MAKVSSAAADETFFMKTSVKKSLFYKNRRGQLVR